jgi:CheY-like chemotaxis protein
MRRSAVVVCEDSSSLATLKKVLEKLKIDPVICRSKQAAMQTLIDGNCSTVIADFDIPGAGEVVKMAALLPPAQKPLMLAVARPWPNSAEAFQSGANRILYKPLAPAQLKDAFEPVTAPVKTKKIRKEDRRKSPRYEMKALVYLDFERGTVPALGLNLSESGFAVQATEPVAVCTNLAFRCLLPGTNHKLQGQCDVIWADKEGRAGMFFSRLTPAARKHLKHWLHHRGSRGRKLHAKEKAHDSLRALLPPVGSSAHHGAHTGLPR